MKKLRPGVGSLGDPRGATERGSLSSTDPVVNRAFEGAVRKEAIDAAPRSM
jgi:hypothetical protein